MEIQKTKWKYVRYFWNHADKKKNISKEVKILFFGCFPYIFLQQHIPSLSNFRNVNTVFIPWDHQLKLILFVYLEARGWKSPKIDQKIVSKASKEIEMCLIILYQVMKLWFTQCNKLDIIVTYYLFQGRIISFTWTFFRFQVLSSELWI